MLHESGLRGSGASTRPANRSYELLAGGVRHINVYNYGPAYASIDSWSTRSEIYPTIAAVQHEAGAIDAALTGTTCRATDVVILYNRASGIWGDTASTSEQDGRYTHWALAQAGYDADFLAAEDIEGGVAMGRAGAASRDEFDRPLDTLAPVFGTESRELRLESDAGRPKYELRTQRVLDQLSTGGEAGVPKVTFPSTLLPRNSDSGGRRPGHLAKPFWCGGGCLASPWQGKSGADRGHAGDRLSLRSGARRCL